MNNARLEDAGFYFSVGRLRPVDLLVLVKIRSL